MKFAPTLITPTVNDCDCLDPRRILFFFYETYRCEYSAIVRGIPSELWTLYELMALCMSNV